LTLKVKLDGQRLGRSSRSQGNSQKGKHFRLGIHILRGKNKDMVGWKANLNRKL